MMGVLPVHPTSRAARRTVDVVDNRVEVREFLTSRRAKITPEQAGLPAAGQRRVPGLRRSEVAALAGMSVEYYAKLERGALAGVSAGVLDALARALQLDDAERAHLLRLAHEADGSNAVLRPRRRPKQWTVRPSLQWSLDAITAPGDRRQRPAGPARRQPARPGHVQRPLRRPDQPTELRPVHLPRQRRPPLLPRLGPRRRHDASPTCAPPPARTPTTRPCTTSSASCPPAATTSAAAGAPTTSAPTAPASNTSTTTSSATSPSPTKAWTCAPNPTSP